MSCLESLTRDVRPERVRRRRRSGRDANLVSASGVHHVLHDLDGRLRRNDESVREVRLVVVRTVGPLDGRLDRRRGVGVD